MRLSPRDKTPSEPPLETGLMAAYRLPNLPQDVRIRRATCGLQHDCDTDGPAWGGKQERSNVGSQGAISLQLLVAPPQTCVARCWPTLSTPMEHC